MTEETEFNLDYVNCPITDAEFTLVRRENSESIKKFSDWIDDLILRADNGKFINISVDCEGFCLGSVEKSLGCIQLGEIFHDDFDIRSENPPEVAPHVGNKPGFIVIFPTSIDVIRLVSCIFRHPQIMIFTFDFTKDFCAMIDAGVKIDFNLYNIFDSQVSTLKNIQNHLLNTRVRGLKWFVNEAIEMDPLAEKACEKLNYGKHSYFDIIMFLYKDQENPFKNMINKELLEMAAADIYMTGLAAVYCINSSLIQNTFVQTQQKLFEFCQISQQCRTWMAPSFYREIAFFNYFRLSFYSNEISYKDETEEDILALLSIFRETFTLISAGKYLGQHYNGKIKIEQAKEVYEKVVQKLEKNRETLQEMKIKFSE
ncbi:hypothetical protein TRFO_08397 [Tritrichomonas foetus]|uniref:3'-5' exonuclease domain-containing protein n=1 Tax=Tritrichomonas foetus TaxID=1144522 RepID=A0A1J4JJY2_9EUKA|nr:hypothetical protein TRFO_08397 [Tritrichomonas foetus]|eukprot:OHS99458.1 hypothetical protein TRFO_08397 [Tritrichomonas foetus]